MIQDTTILPPINISDVQEVLDVEDNNLSSLCTNSNINPFSLNKPTGNSLGLRAPSTSSGQEGLLAALAMYDPDTLLNGWTFREPDAPYNLGDFNGYNHRPESYLLYSSYSYGLDVPDEVLNELPIGITVIYTMNTNEDETRISLDDFIRLYGNYYLGLICANTDTGELAGSFITTSRVSSLSEGSIRFEADTSTLDTSDGISFTFYPAMFTATTIDNAAVMLFPLAQSFYTDFTTYSYIGEPSVYARWSTTDDPNNPYLIRICLKMHNYTGRNWRFCGAGYGSSIDTVLYNGTGLTRNYSIPSFVYEFGDHEFQSYANINDWTYIIQIVISEEEYVGGIRVQFPTIYVYDDSSTNEITRLDWGTITATVLE